MKYLLLLLGAVFLAQMFLMGGCAHKQKSEEMIVEQQPAETPAVVEAQAVVETPTTTLEKPLNIGTIYFDFDKYVLLETSKKELQGVALYLQLNLEFSLLIEGHADERGTIEYNLALGQKRAASAKDYIGLFGVDANRISTLSFGEEKPVSSEHSKNRRCEIIIK